MDIQPTFTCSSSTVLCNSRATIVSADQASPASFLSPENGLGSKSHSSSEQLYDSVSEASSNLVSNSAVTCSSETKLPTISSHAILNGNNDSNFDVTGSSNLTSASPTFHNSLGNHSGSLVLSESLHVKNSANKSVYSLNSISKSSRKSCSPKKIGHRRSIENANLKESLPIYTPRSEALIARAKIKMLEERSPRVGGSRNNPEPKVSVDSQLLKSGEEDSNELHSVEHPKALSPRRVLNIQQKVRKKRRSKRSALHELSRKKRSLKQQALDVYQFTGDDDEWQTCTDTDASSGTEDFRHKSTPSQSARDKSMSAVPEAKDERLPALESMPDDSEPDSEDLVPSRVANEQAMNDALDSENLEMDKMLQSEEEVRRSSRKRKAKVFSDDENSEPVVSTSQPPTKKKFARLVGFIAKEVDQELSPGKCTRLQTARKRLSLPPTSSLSAPSSEPSQTRATESRGCAPSSNSARKSGTRMSRITDNSLAAQAGDNCSENREELVRLIKTFLIPEIDKERSVKTRNVARKRAHITKSVVLNLPGKKNKLIRVSREPAPDEETTMAQQKKPEQDRLVQQTPESLSGADAASSPNPASSPAPQRSPLPHCSPYREEPCVSPRPFSQPRPSERAMKQDVQATALALGLKEKSSGTTCSNAIISRCKLLNTSPASVESMSRQGKESHTQVLHHDPCSQPPVRMLEVPSAKRSTPGSANSDPEFCKPLLLPKLASKVQDMPSAVPKEPLCACTLGSTNFYMKVRSLRQCHAQDCVDGKARCCSHQGYCMGSPAQNIPCVPLCRMHYKRLQLHHGCPGCGLYCTQGRYMVCKENGVAAHYFHKECQLSRNGQLYCPHCGAAHTQQEVDLVLPDVTKGPLPIVPMPKLGARITCTSRLLPAPHDTAARGPRMQLLPPEVQLELTLRLRGGRTLSCARLPETANLEQLKAAFNAVAKTGFKPQKRQTGKTLQTAVENCDLVEIIQRLVDGWSPDQRLKNNQTAMHVAARMGKVETLLILLLAEGCIDVQDSDCRTPLVVAIEHNQLDAAKYLVTEGADVNTRGEDGMTALHYAAREGHLNCLKFLLEQCKLDPNLVDDGGWIALTWSIENKYVDAVRYLMAMGSDPSIRDQEHNTALHWAAYSGCEQTAQLALLHGCDINAVNENGDTPLHIAARQDHFNVVIMLLARGSNTLWQNKNGETAQKLSAAVESHSWLALQLHEQLTQRRDSRRERVVHRDLSRGQEKNPIPAINWQDDEPVPSNYLYVTKSVETQPLHVNRLISSIQVSCECKDNCTGPKCQCARNSIRNWYDEYGVLSPELNLMEPPFIFECNRACRCWSTCANRVVQHGITCRLQVFKTDSRGWGVRTILPISRGAYVCEYIGELISDQEADRREDDSYLFDLDNRDGETYCIDGKLYGNVARFINHHCDPNLVPVKVFVNHQDLRFPRICFFASRDIEASEELGFDYGEKFWVIKWQQFTCTCGADKCRFSTTTIHKTLEEFRQRTEESEEESVG